jgi:hypothetical protein
MTVIVDQTTVNPPGFAVVATIAVAPPTGTKNLAGAKLMHRHGDQITVTAITVPTAGATTPDSGPYVKALEAKGTKVLAESVLVLRQNDQSAVVSAIPKIPGSPPVEYPVTFKCIISNAGQTKVLAK